MRMDYYSYLQDLDLSKRILEIGPLATPLLTKSEANVWYADIHSQQEVKDIYKGCPEVNQDEICAIDFVIQGSYTESLRNVEKFDYIISSHVIEHIPRFIEFFLDTANILNEHGKMLIFAPDCRYCFDRFRTPTSFAQMYYIHTQGLACAPWQVLESAGMSVRCNDPKLFWANKRVFSLLTKRSSFADAKEAFEMALRGEPVGGHFSAFTPESFLLILHEMTRAGLFPYKLLTFFPTLKGAFTFGAELEVCPELPTSEDLSEQALIGLRRTMVQLVDYEEKQHASVGRQ